MQFEFSTAEAPLFDIVKSAGEALGYRVYLVGGYVRDRLLGRPSNDIDIVCEGSGIKLAEAVAAQLKPEPHVAVYRRFGTALVKHADFHIEFVGAALDVREKADRLAATYDANWK